MSYSNLSEGQIIKTVFDASTGALRVSPTGGQLVSEEFDHIDATYPDAVTEVYTYKAGGAGGTVVATVTIVYTSGTKDLIQSVDKT